MCVPLTFPRSVRSGVLLWQTLNRVRHWKNLFVGEVYARRQRASSNAQRRAQLADELRRWERAFPWPQMPMPRGPAAGWPFGPFAPAPTAIGPDPFDPFAPDPRGLLPPSPPDLFWL